MAVNTPQLDIPVYQPKDMATAQGPQMTPPQPLPSSAGFVSKSGAAAYVATNILDGWMKGREVAQQRALAKAQNQVQGADYTYSTMAKNYNDLLKSGKSETDASVVKAKQAAVDAWNNKLNVMQQYTAPDPSQKPKGAKAKTENFLTQHFTKAGIEPQMLPQASLQILRNSPPPGLGLSNADKIEQTQVGATQDAAKLTHSQAESAQLKLEHDKAQQADDTKAETITKIQPQDRTPSQRQWLEGWQRVQHINDPEEKKLADGILTKIQNGQVLNDTERNFAYAQRLISAPQQTFRTDANGNDQMLTIGQDGKVLSTVKLGKHYTPDEVGPAMRLAEAQQKMMYQTFDKATPQVQGESPEDRKRRVYGMVAAEQTRNPYLTSSFLTADPQQKEQDMDQVNRALQTVYKNWGGPGLSTTQRKSAQKELDNFIYPGTDTDPGDAGMFVFRQQAADPTGKTLFGRKPEYAGGLTQDNLAQKQAAIVNQVRATLLQQSASRGVKLTQADVDRMIPPWLSGQGSGGPHAMAATPGSSAASGPQGMQPAPGSGQTYGKPGGANKKYTVRTSDGVTSTVYMTPADATDMQSQGAQVSE